MGEFDGAVMQEDARTREHVRDRVFALLTEVANVPADRIGERSTVDEDLILTSVAFVELQVAIEDTYDIQLDPIQIVELNELGAIIDYIYECVAGAA